MRSFPPCVSDGVVEATLRDLGVIVVVQASHLPLVALGASHLVASHLVSGRLVSGRLPVVAVGASHRHPVVGASHLALVGVGCPTLS